MEVRGSHARLASLLSAVILLISPVSRANEAWRFGGHIKYQFSNTVYRANDLNDVLGGDPAKDHTGELRLKADGRQGPWDVSVHYELLAVSGDTVEVQNRLGSAGPAAIFSGDVLPQDDRRLFDLTHTLSDGARHLAVHRLDRLAVGYTTASAVIRFGRQAVSWGNGLAFQVLDFINPFSPVAIDKDYKTGDDMLYMQWSMPDRSGEAGADVQVMVVPRRDPDRREIEPDESSFAAKLRSRVAGWDIELLGARHYSENIVGIGLARGIGGAIWRLDASHTALAHGDDVVSLLTNLDYSWVWGQKNYYGYVEYFRSGVGEAKPQNYITPNVDLAQRIERGELFTLARDYFSVGVQTEITPLSNLYHNLIWNVDDDSFFYQMRGVYDFQQNAQLIAGVNLPYGDRGDEFGGIPTPIPRVYAAPGRSLFLRVAWFF